MQHGERNWKYLEKRSDRVRVSKLCLNRVPEEENKKGGNNWGDNDWVNKILRLRKNNERDK